MQLTRTRIKKINAVYSLEGTVLENGDNIKYLGVTISKDLKWNTHVSNVYTKANRPLGFLKPNLSSCPQDVKEMVYKGLVRPVLEYACPVWDPHGIVAQEELEKVQNRAARLVTGNYITKTCLFKHIHRKIHLQKLKKISNKNSDICQSMFLSENKKNNIYPCKPQFYYIKVGFKVVKII